MNIEHYLRRCRTLLPLLAAALFVLGAAAGEARAQLTMATPTTVDSSEPTPTATPTNTTPPPTVVIIEEPAPTPTPTTTNTAACERTVKADVVALDQVITYNRLGAVNPAGMIYALRRDVTTVDASRGLVAGNVRLKAYKRPRPLVLRMNAGDCIQIAFQNLLDPSRRHDDQPITRWASVHAVGLQLVGSINSDGSYVGNNSNSLVAPGNSAVYTLYAEKEGNHLIYSTAATTGGEGDGGQIAMGLFGSINVEPRGSEWYRSQLTEADMTAARVRNADGTLAVTKGGHPIVNYDAVYPKSLSSDARQGLTPIIKILDGNLNIVHSDLNAIITGPNRGNFAAGTYNPIATAGDASGATSATTVRNRPFREFSIIYHDELKAVQAFPQFNEEKADGTQNPLAHTLHSVRDAFGINYGTGGIGSEIIANRLGLGPMKDCTECLYEEFFLSAWTVGDPAQIVDRPASTQVDSNGNKIPNSLPATKVLFPDDPSNVYHSYLNDPVKMRVVHAGPKEHHIHHLHAHQWLNSPESDNSAYLDSKAFGPGYSFTTEITYGGSGNRNKTPGDSIFHCHFYPHFAMGMWSLWRVHDVFEAGTQIDPATGRPTQAARKLPDGEIAAGTPIPALVPVPTLVMPPMPSAAFQGFPFYIAGVAGHRPPHPPMDTPDDGGLPRHVITGGTVTHHKEHDPVFSFVKARLDFDKSLKTAVAIEVPEAGTAAEQAAMAFHATRSRVSYKPDGTEGAFLTNGLPAKPGAPFADPCGDNGVVKGVERIYKGAYIQLDITLNKAGWHTPQSRIATLWNDVRPTIAGQRPPEPLFFRANSNDCITYYHSNLVPRVYAQDDFQVRTPTDVMGQHIHLVKFDVLASDGSGNGWNYEDGTFSPQEVQERIHAINAAGGFKKADGTIVKLEPRQHPALGLSGRDDDGNGVDDWLGAQTTIQRWWVDPTLNLQGQDRTLRTVFTHDHYGPSTHQQTGLYAGLVVEPLGSRWRDPETGTVFGGAGIAPRSDGGPTSWKADIITNPDSGSYREYLLEFADFQLAYQAGGGVDARGLPVADPARAINPPVKDEVGLPEIVMKANVCPGSTFAPPCPEAIAAADTGTMSVNYRNEPIPLRVTDAYGNLAAGDAGDLGHVYRSNVIRANPAFNTQPGFYPPLTGDVMPGDPYTPLLRAYEDDPVQIRILVGAHEEGHNFGIHGIKWKYEPSEPNSGYRNNQMMGISEHYEFIVPKLPRKFDDKAADYLYAPGMSVDDQWNGLWGLMRVYAQRKYDLVELPNNLKKSTLGYTNQGDFAGVCPKTAPVRPLNVTAVAARSALPEGSLVYNNRESTIGGKLHDPTAIMFFRSDDIDIYGKVKAGVPVEPLILRAKPGECLQVTLRNSLPAGQQFDLPGFNTMPMIVEGFNANDVVPSSHVGLHAQNVFFDVTRSNGVNVGFNPVQTAAPGQTVTYQWYVGDITPNSLGAGVPTPIEFGTTALSSADPIKHSNKGAYGALIIEPAAAASWTEDATSRASATIMNANGVSLFREHVMVFQNDINLRYNSYYGLKGRLDNGQAVPNLAEQEDAEDSGQKAVNYRTEPLWKRMGFDPATPLEQTRDVDFTNSLSNIQVGGDPVTPVFTAQAGEPVRLRLVHPGGHARNNVFLLHGHIWEEEPYINGSAALGTNPRSNWVGSMYGIGPGSHFDFLLKNGAGGKFGVTGDYLWRTFQAPQFNGGIWGIFRVCAAGTICQSAPPPPPPTGCTNTCPPGQLCPDVCRVESVDTVSSQ